MNFLRINGRGNAWPIPIGQHHPFYELPGGPDYANASYSLVQVDGQGRIHNELLVDAGHGIVPFLLKVVKRIPDAMLITHPHFDHTLGMDWIIQSYYRYRDKKKYPVYATRGCREQIVKTMPHLEELCDFTELSYGRPMPVREAGTEMTVTAFPVFHGHHARGAAMLLTEEKQTGRRLLFTGDVLIPLLRKDDLQALQGTDWLLADTNNRFPYPKTNHWSVTRHAPEDEAFLAPWLENLAEETLMAPHNFQSFENYQYLLDFFRDFAGKEEYILTLLDFVRSVRPENLILSHYSGLEDEKYYGEKLLDTPALEKWGQQVIDHAGIRTKVTVPETGEMISLRSRN